MIRHIVLWKLKEPQPGRTKRENAELLKQKLEVMKENISVVRKLEVGLKLDSSVYSNFDVVLDSYFDSYEDLVTYQTHPLHRELVAWISNIRETRASVDYEIN
jgi:hypothetical protein